MDCPTERAKGEEGEASQLVRLNRSVIRLLGRSLATHTSPHCARCCLVVLPHFEGQGGD